MPINGNRMRAHDRRPFRHQIPPGLHARIQGIRDGTIKAPSGPRNVTLMSEVKRLLKLRKSGSEVRRLEFVAEQFIRMMESGSFAHMKEYIEREEGKVQSNMNLTADKDVKAYVGIPVDDQEGAP